MAPIRKNDVDDEDQKTKHRIENLIILSSCSNSRHQSIVWMHKNIPKYRYYLYEPPE